MADYSKTTNFTAKDSLPSGNPAKIIKGADHDTEYDNIETSIATKANKVSGATANSILKDDGNGDLVETALLESDLKAQVKDWGTKSASFTLEMSDADLHIVDCSAALTITISSTKTNDKALVVIKNGNFAITLSGIDNDSPTLTQSASTQDFLGIVKSFGKITCVGTALNKSTV